MRILRMFFILALGIFGALVVLVAWNSDTGYAYRMHYGSNARLTLDFNDLKAMPSSAVVNSFPVGLFCRSGKSELGDSFCATELTAWQSVEALDTVFFFESDSLVYAKVDVPPWAHGELLEYVKRVHGEPAGFTTRMLWGKFLLAGAGNIAARSVGAPLTFDMSPDELGVWKLPSGACLVVNMEADWPLQWSTAFWIGPGKPCMSKS